MRAVTMSAGLVAILALGLGGCGGAEVGASDGGSARDGLGQDRAVPGATGGQAGTSAATGGSSAVGSTGSTGGIAGAGPGSGGASGGGLAGSGGRGGVTGGSGSGGSSGSLADGGADARTADAASEGKSCGQNPAEVCRTSPDECIASACSCSNGTWACTADCSGGRNCADAGTGKADAAGSGVPCGNVLCTGENYCCNVNCGMCAPMGAACIQIACQPPSTWACNGDADCRIAADYCGGCNCRALGPSGTLATCTDGGVACFADPCASKVARCLQGQCAVAAKTAAN